MPGTAATSRRRRPRGFVGVTRARTPRRTCRRWSRTTSRRSAPDESCEALLLTAKGRRDRSADRVPAKRRRLPAADGGGARASALAPTLLRSRFAAKADDRDRGARVVARRRARDASGRDREPRVRRRGVRARRRRATCVGRDRRGRARAPAHPRRRLRASGASSTSASFRRRRGSTNARSTSRRAATRARSRSRGSTTAGA